MAFVAKALRLVVSNDALSFASAIKRSLANDCTQTHSVLAILPNPACITLARWDFDSIDHNRPSPALGVIQSVGLATSPVIAHGRSVVCRK